MTQNFIIQTRYNKSSEKVETSFFNIKKNIKYVLEPEPGTSYQRHVDETPQTNFQTSQPDYTLEWRHIYIAANNLFSGVSFTIFVFVAAFDIL